MTIIDGLIFVAVIVVMIFLSWVARRLAEKSAQPYIDQIKRIEDSDLPIGEKIDLINKVGRRHY